MESQWGPCDVQMGPLGMWRVEEGPMWRANGVHEESNGVHVEYGKVEEGPRGDQTGFLWRTEGV